MRIGAAKSPERGANKFAAPQGKIGPAQDAGSATCADSLPHQLEPAEVADTRQGTGFAWPSGGFPQRGRPGATARANNIHHPFKGKGRGWPHNSATALALAVGFSQSLMTT